MFKEIAQALTDSIDEITRRWVEELRYNARTEVHKQLLSADIVDGVKGMLANFALAISQQEAPDGETLPLPIVGKPDANPMETTPLGRIKATKPLSGPLAQARVAAASLGRLRHNQGYEIQEVIFEYVVLRQQLWDALRSSRFAGESDLNLGFLAYVDRLLDELMLTTVENFYNTSLRDLETRAIHDPLTQLYNKDYFHQRLNEELRRSVRYAQPISVVMLDLDLLKTINDTYGHPAGDEAIKAIAVSIRDTCRQTDVPCRYGGDEFAVILPETSRAQAQAFAERVMHTVQNLTIVVVPGDQALKSGVLTPIDESTEGQAESSSGRSPVFAPAPSISIGLASFPEDARNPETLLAKADAALYRAKNEGRNRIAS